MVGLSIAMTNCELIGSPPHSPCSTRTIPSGLLPLFCRGGVGLPPIARCGSFRDGVSGELRNWERRRMSLADTIRNTFVPVHREGWPFVAAFAGATIVLGLFSTSLFWIGLILTAWCAYFFRDPERVTPIDDRLVISPADGVVSSVGPAVAPRELGLGTDEMMRVCVFMNVFSCHVNRAPARGRVSAVEHRPGKFLNAEMDKASTENERNGVVIESPNGRMGV